MKPELGSQVLSCGISGQSGASPCLEPPPPALHSSSMTPPPPPKHFISIFPRLALISYPLTSPLVHSYPSLGIFKEKREGQGGGWGGEESSDNEILMGDYWCIIEQYPW